jgi:hypothetical protein
MGAIPREVLAFVAVCAVLVAVAQALFHAWVRGARRHRILGRVTRAGIGEARAADHLVSLGFEILGAQVATDYPVTVDGKETQVSVRADYVVRRGEARYVVEVKTGSVAPRIETSATRRQLLEYRVAFDVDGVLLLDAEAGRLHEITFPGVGARVPVAAAEARSGWGWLVVLGLAAALAAVMAFVSRSTL